MFSKIWGDPLPEIIIRGARLHNLKDISFSIPKNKLVVFTGVSGSGKSTMAFDILHKEGQHQYMESLGMVTYESRPFVESIVGLSPSISVDQRNRNRSPRSTVGTATEVYTYLRVLYSRIGHRPCPKFGADVPPEHGINEMVEAMWEDEDGEGEVEYSTSCPNCGVPLPRMGMASFSFNKPGRACPTCTGMGVIFSANLQQIIDEEKSVIDGAVLLWEPSLPAWYIKSVRAAGRHYGFGFNPSIPVCELGPVQRDLLLYGSGGALY